MGGVGLLTREGEKEIAMRIEEAKGEIKEMLLSFPGTVKELLNVYSSFKQSDLSLAEIASEAEDADEMGEEDAQRERIIDLLEALAAGLSAVEEGRRTRKRRTAAGRR